MRRVLAVVSTGLLLSACALFTDFGGYSEGDGAPKGDGSEGGAGTLEAGPEGEAGRPSSDAGAEASCGHFLCEDFDDDAGFARWKPVVVDWNEPPVTMATDSLTATTQPTSLLVETPNVRWGTEAYLQQVIALGDSAGLRCTFDVRLDAIPSDGQYKLLEIAAAEAAQFHGAALVLRGGGTRIDLGEDVEEDAGPANYVNGFSTGLGQWRNVVVTFQRTPEPKAILSDGVQVYAMPMPSWPASSKIALRLGLVFGNPYRLDTAPLRVRYDSLHCDAL